MKNGKLTGLDYKREAIKHYYNNEILTYPIEIAIKNTVKEFYYSEKTIKKIISEKLLGLE